MRMLAVFAAGFGSALWLIPVLMVGQMTTPPTALQAEAARKFRSYLEADWKRWMEEYPDVATMVGYPGQNSRWIDDSPAGIERRKKHLSESVLALEEIHRDALPESEKLNFELYSQLLETAQQGLQYGDDPLPFRFVVPRNLWMPLNQMQGIQQQAAETLANTPHHTVAEYETVLERLKALPAAVEQHIGLLQAGLRMGYTPPRIALRDVPKQIADLIPADPMASALLQPFTEFPAGFSEADRARLTEQAKKTYKGGVAPAFQKLGDYLASTYLPACRNSIAATALPSGPAGYAFHVHWQTTTDLTPPQIHEIGLSEVKRIRAEMDKVITSAGFGVPAHRCAVLLRQARRLGERVPDHCEEDRSRAGS
jgi:uncharacterized protein (DUF885 family)